MRRILVTGADGFVGNVLSSTLEAAGHHVLRVVRAGRGEGLVAVGDIGRYDAWIPLLGGVDVVIHLAARAHVMRERTATPLEEFRRVNCAATARLARAAAAVGVRRFIFLSSIGVNGTFTAGKPFSESDAPKPIEPYAISKWEAELALLDISAGSDMQITRVRPPLILGAGVKGNLRRLVKLVDTAMPLPFAALRNRRSFVVLEDLCELLKLCVTHDRAGGQLFLAAQAEDISTPELLRNIAECLGRRPRLVSCPPSVMRFVAGLFGARMELERLTSSLLVDASHARLTLNWQSRARLWDGIRSMVKAYLDTRREVNRFGA